MKILIVDDEDVNLDLLQEYLDEEGFEVVRACDGEDAFKKLQKNYDVRVVLLDKMMPKLNGIEFLQRIKIDTRLKDIPVIMQTADINAESVVEGINAGVFYYLTKPYKKDVLMSIINAAIDDSRYRSYLVEEVSKHKESIGLMMEGSFEVRTTAEAQNMAYFIANAFPDPEKVILGISEMLINAIEHGNLRIGYEEKGKLMREGRLIEEIRRRERLSENRQKKVRLKFRKVDDGVIINIKDEGKGFEWEQYMEMHPERASDPNGRGIMMARMMSFDEMNYLGNGSEVECKVSLMREVKEEVA